MFLTIDIEPKAPFYSFGYTIFLEAKKCDLLLRSDVKCNLILKASPSQHQTVSGP